MVLGWGGIWMGVADRVAAEVRDKFEWYETRQSRFMSDYNEWADIFKVRKPVTRSISGSSGGSSGGTGIRGYSNPRLTEMFRAVNALATMEVRMMTSQD